MYYFIPSWYSRDDKWTAATSRWYRKTNEYEFDDTINQVRMFLRAGEQTQMVIPAYFPQLRHFLHQQNIAASGWWSAFDAMQGIHARRPGILSYEDLDWPDNVEWVFNPFNVQAYWGGYQYARVEFGEDGNLFFIDYLKSDGQMDRRAVFDDRGFLSSVIFYQGENPVRQEFYDEYGALQFTEDKLTGTVKINPRSTYWFHRTDYADIREMLTEVMKTWFDEREDLDRSLVVIAANEQHNDMITGILPGRRIVLSFFDNRFDLENTEALKESVSRAKFVVADTEHVAKLIRNAAGEGLPVYDISPFDTRLSLGRSQRIRELKIFMPVDGLEGIYLEKALRQVMQYMEKNEDVILLLGMRNPNADAVQKIKDEAKRVQQEAGIGPFYFKSDAEQEAELQDMQVERKAARLFIADFSSESDLIQILYDTRLILDVRDQPDLYVQIAGISAGIPQVNYRFTRYVEHQKDGYIIQNINYITGALEYYLSGLAHWNEALVYCVQEISKYTGGQQVEKWKEMAGA